MQAIEYRKAILSELKSGADCSVIARRIYLTYPTYSFQGKPDREFAIKDRISNKYGVDIFSIHFGGSGKTGESYHKENEFKPGESDLDAAIISNTLFLLYLEEAVTVTDGFKDLTSYAGRTNDFEQFQQRLCRGILIPELMPSCNLRSEWQKFFENLSFGNSDLFKDINCWIYSSQKIYEWKFANTIKILKGVKID